MQLVDRSGVRTLTQLSGLEELAQCLQELRVLCSDVDSLTRELVRSEAISALRAARIANGARLVDQVLPKKRQASSEDGSQKALVSDVEPWDEDVDTSDLVTALCEVFRRHVTLDAHEALAAALWTLHTYCLDSASVSPKLAILSPTKRCGKTTLLKLLQAVVRRPLTAANISTAAVYRVIEREHPTLLIDEVDTFLANNNELRGVLNAGHDRATSRIVRCDTAERAHALCTFDAWGAVAFAGIGSLPSTLADRSITILLKRSSQHAATQRLTRAICRSLGDMARKCRRWSLDHQHELLERQPSLSTSMREPRTTGPRCWRLRDLRGAHGLHTQLMQPRS